MSGDPPRVELAGLDPVLAAIARATVALEAAGRPCALIGGVAVMVRTGGVYRSTNDADSAVDSPADAESSAELLARARVGKPGGGAAPQRVLVDGIALDCIDTVPVDDLEGLSDRDALFVGGHRFAYDTAEAAVLVGDDIELTVVVGTVAGLVATKLHAARYRRQVEKRGADVSDLVRLLEADVDATAAALRADRSRRGARVRELVAEGVHAVLLANVAEARGRALRVGLDISEARIAVAARAFLGLFPDELTGG